MKNPSIFSLKREKKNLIRFNVRKNVKDILNENKQILIKIIQQMAQLKFHLRKTLLLMENESGSVYL